MWISYWKILMFHQIIEFNMKDNKQVVLVFQKLEPVWICRNLLVAVKTFTPRCWNHQSSISLLVYCRSSERLNGFSVGWQYSACIQPLFWSGNTVSVGIRPDRARNACWKEGRFALLQPELCAPGCEVEEQSLQQKKCIVGNILVFKPLKEKERG